MTEKERKQENDILEENAILIAQVIEETDTDYRGNLLEKVSEQLHKNAQSFTAGWIANAASNYGINPKLK